MARSLDKIKPLLHPCVIGGHMDSNELLDAALKYAAEGYHNSHVPILHSGSA